MNFTLICEHDDYTKVTHEFYSQTLSDVLTQFEAFLRGNQYHFDGIVDVVDQPEECDIAFEFDPDDAYEHSEYFYDFDRNLDPLTPVEETAPLIQRTGGRL